MEFGVKELNGSLVPVGPLELNLEDLLNSGKIAKEGDKVRVSIFYEKPRFYISKSRLDPNRHYLDLVYPIK